MAKITKPERINKKGLPPPEAEAPANLARSADQDLRPLNFKVRADFKREFKAYATQMDISMVDLLQQCFVHFKESR